MDDRATRKGRTCGTIVVDLERRRAVDPPPDRVAEPSADRRRQASSEAGITPRVSRRGDALDDAPMEGFVHTPKTEPVHHGAYATRDRARRDLFAHVEDSCNRRGLHSGLGYRTPDESGQRAAKVA